MWRRQRWTVDTLKEHYDDVLAERDKALAAALAAQKESARTLADATADRFEGVNEFRGQLTDQAASFLTRAEYQAKHDALLARVDTAESALDKARGMYLLLAVIALIMPIIGAVIVIATRH
jgi:hypothetical protein